MNRVVAAKMTRRDLTVCVSVVGLEIWMLVLACTLPLPAGYFMPVFVYGEWERKKTWANANLAECLNSTNLSVTMKIFFYHTVM